MRKAKMKVIRVQKKATPREVAIARGKAYNFVNGAPDADDGSGFGAPTVIESKVDYAKAANVAADVTGKLIQSKPGRVSKGEFYAFRDNAYSTIKQMHGDNSLESLPGNPFNQFGHGTIKDSPVKNYSSELEGLKSMIKQYFPDVYATLNIQAGNAKKQNIINTDIDPGSVEEILQGVSSDYIQNLEAKAASGQTLTNAEKKILQAYEFLNNKLRQGAKKRITEDVGEWLLDNWIVVVVALLLLVMILKKK